MTIATGRERRRGEDGESVFVSMTDLTVSFLFIVLILLAFFATQFKPEDTVPRAEHDEALNALARAVADARRLEDHLDAVLGERDAARAERDAALTRTEALAAEIANLRTALAEALARIKALDAGTARLERAINAALAERDMARTERDTALTRVESLAAEIANLRTALAEALARIKALDAGTARLERAINAALAERDMARTERDTALTRVESLAAEIANLRTALAEALARIKALDAGTARLERAINAALAERDMARTERDTALTRVESLAAEIANLRASLAAALTRIETLDAGTARLEQALNAALAERNAAVARAEALATETARLDEIVAALEREILRLRTQIAELETPDPLATYLESAARTRANLLERLAERIRRELPGIRVTVVAADGVIRFRGDDLFDPGVWRVRPDSTAWRVARAVGDALIDTLPCHTFPRGTNGTPPPTGSCEGGAAIETIQIEGHTDDIPLSPALRKREEMLDNRDLSARRGAETLRAMTDRHRPALMDFLNMRGQPVLSFAGYGATRPISANRTPEGRAANRRIDIRFILQTPRNPREVEELRERLAHRAGLPTTETGP